MCKTRFGTHCIEHCAFLLLNFRNAPAPPAPLTHIKLLHVNSVSSVKWDDGTQWDLVLGLPVE